MNPQLILEHDPTLEAFLTQSGVLVTHESRDSQQFMRIPHTLETTMFLRSQGVSAPPPVLTQYKFPASKPAFFTQKTSVGMMTTEPRNYVLNGIGCVDSDTEYLTPTGWARIADYRAGEVAQYLPSTGEIEFVTPSKFVKLPCQSMVRLQTKYGIDQLLSPEHRVLLADGRVMTASHLFNTYGSRASREYKFPTTFKVRDRVGMSLTDHQIRVQVAVNADGYYAPLHRDGITTVRLRRDRKVDRLVTLLANAGIEYKVRPCEPAGFRRITFFAPMNKGFNSDWWKCTQRQLEVVASELTHWDGSFRKKDGWAFSSRAIEDAEFAQYAYSAAGRRASLSRVTRKDGGVDYVVFASANNPTPGVYGVSKGIVRNNVRIEAPSDGFKYCFMVPSTFLLLRRNGCIFATGNTGKTRCVLWAFDYLQSIGKATRMLVFAPISTLTRVWARELMLEFSHLKYNIIYGDKKKRLKLLSEDVDVYIINHDGTAVIADELAKRDDIDVFAIDELSVYRNGDAKRTKLLRSLAKSRYWVWGLTGSPMPRDVTDVWGQCTIVTPHTVPKYYSHLRQTLCYRAGPFKWEARDGAIEKALSYMSPSVRFTLDDVTELPPKVIQYVEVPMGPKQKVVYDAMRRSALALIDSQEIDALNAGAVMSKLLQIALGWVYTRDKQAIQLDNQDRIQTIVDFVDGCQRKVIVFVPFKSGIAGISAALSANDIDHRVVTGDTPMSERNETFSLFQDSAFVKVLLAHPQCMAHGLTLTAADTIVWAGPVTSLETFMQANGRITRVGQMHKQLIAMIGGTTVERKLYELLGRNEAVQNKFLQLVEEASRE
jgi:hypothetical protein